LTRTMKTRLLLLLIIISLNIPIVKADSTVTFYPTLDGHIRYLNGVYNDVNTASISISLGEDAEGFPDYAWFRGYLRFDISSIPDNATIANATLVIYYSAKTNNNAEGDRAVAEVADVGDTLTSADWGNAVVIDHGIIIPVANVTDIANFYSVDVTSSIQVTDGFITFRINSTVEDNDANYWWALIRSVDYGTQAQRPHLIIYITTGPEWNDIGFQINSAFEFFGILDFMNQAITFVNSIGAHFVDSLINLAVLINLQFQVIWQVWGWATGWFTRMITAVLNFGNQLSMILNGTHPLLVGPVDLWNYFNFASAGQAVFDVAPIFLILYWIDSMGKRARTQGSFQVIYGDLGAFANVFAYFMGAFSTLIGFIEGKISWLLNALT